MSLKPCSPSMTKPSFNAKLNVLASSELDIVAFASEILLDISTFTVYARIYHFSEDSHGLLFLNILLAWYIKYILVFQRNICRLARHDALYVYGYCFKSTVRFLSVHHCMSSKRILRQAFSVFNQRTDAGNVTSNLIHSGTEHGTFYLNHI